MTRSKQLNIRVRGSIGLSSAAAFLDPLCGIRDRMVVVDLSDVTFAEPFALVRLAAQLESIARAGVRARVVCPSEAGCRRYLAASNFVQNVSMFAELQGDTQLRAVEPSWKSQTVLPLMRLTATADLAPAIERIRERLTTVLGVTQGDERRSVGAFRATVVEMCGNVFQHADYPYAWIAAQRYRARRPYLELVIADAGCGIRSSLASTYPDLRNEPEAEALRRALAGLSRFPDAERGGGFGHMQKAADQLSASVYLRSGMGELRRSRGGGLDVRTCNVAWPGATLRLRIPCRGT